LPPLGEEEGRFAGEEETEVGKNLERIDISGGGGAIEFAEFEADGVEEGGEWGGE